MGGLAWGRGGGGGGGGDECGMSIGFGGGGVRVVLDMERCDSQDKHSQFDFYSLRGLVGYMDIKGFL